MAQPITAILEGSSAFPSSSSWQLPQELVALSNGDRWPQVLGEWELDFIEMLEPGDEPQTCLCHHHPIQEVCHIKNLQNRKTAIVGNCCITRFGETDDRFSLTHKVFIEPSLGMLLPGDLSMKEIEISTLRFFKEEPDLFRLLNSVG